MKSGIRVQCGKRRTVLAAAAAAVGFLVFTRRLSPRVKLALLSVLVILPAWAVVNNLNVMKAVGVVL